MRLQLLVRRAIRRDPPWPAQRAAAYSALASSRHEAPAHPHVAGPAALHGRKGVRPELFLPAEDRALARFPWARLLDAAEDAQRRFGNINSAAYEGTGGEEFGYAAIVREHGIEPLGEDAVREAHDKGAVLLSPPSAELRARLLQGISDRPAPGFPWESAQSADTVADFFFTLVPVVFGRRLYMSHSGDYGNNLMNIMPVPPIPWVLTAIPPETLALLSRVLPESLLTRLGLTPRILRGFSDRKERKMALGLVAASHSLVHRWHTDKGHAERLPELTALLNIRNPTGVPTYMAHLDAILKRLSEEDIAVLEREPLLNRCLCANGNVVSMAVVSHGRSRTRFAASKAWRLGNSAGGPSVDDPFGEPPESPEMLRALENFEKAADEVGYGVEMGPGDLLLFTNDTAVHGRYPLEPQPVPPPPDRTKVRWNKLLYMARPDDLPVFEAPAARWKGRRWIVDKRAFFDWDSIVGAAERAVDASVDGHTDAHAALEKARADRRRFAHLNPSS